MDPACHMVGVGLGQIGHLWLVVITHRESLPHFGKYLMVSGPRQMPWLGKAALWA